MHILWTNLMAILVICGLMYIGPRAVNLLSGKYKEGNLLIDLIIAVILLIAIQQVANASDQFRKFNGVVLNRCAIHHIGQIKQPADRSSICLNNYPCHSFSIPVYFTSREYVGIPAKTQAEAELVYDQIYDWLRKGQ